IYLGPDRHDYSPSGAASQYLTHKAAIWRLLTCDIRHIVQLKNSNNSIKRSLSPPQFDFYSIFLAHSF
ncbi:hypothetical protein, partial [Yersinia pestis]|uniref:hypothetical protein n=1 Tax=Yersinia pestis TaxID=632 RepID=UPI001EE6500A